MLGLITMRTFAAIISGCFVLAFTFSVPWSLFVVTEHSYGGPAWYSQIFGTFLYVTFFIVPYSIAAAVLFVLPAEFLARRICRLSARHLLRYLAWLLAANVSYTGILWWYQPELAAKSAIVCTVGAMLAAFVHVFIMREPDGQRFGLTRLAA